MTRISQGTALLATATLLVGLVACDQTPTRPTQVPAPGPLPTLSPPSPPAVNAAVLAGAYELTMEFTHECGAIPELGTPRRYEVILESGAPYPYLGAWISGGGYPTSTGVGSMWPSVDGKAVGRLSWNNFDVGGCDGIPEPLSAGRGLMVCGEGSGRIDGRTIVAEMTADVYVETNGNRQKVCGGTQLFTFTRKRP
jgi:hypothetical protein